jgi:CBS domain-containing protein
MRSSAIIDRVSSLLDRAVPFDRLPGDERRSLLRDMLVEYFEPDEVILEQGRIEHGFLYVVESGFARLIDTQTQRLMAECGEGDLFGSHGLIHRGPLPYEARAVEPTVCVLIRAEHFQRVYNAHEKFAAFFDSELSVYVRTRRVPADASSARLLFGTRLGELIHREPLTCEPTATAREAAELMREENEDSVIVKNNGSVVGILSDSDLRNGIVAEGASVETIVERLMSPQVILLPEGAPVFDALMEMLSQKAEHVVVTQGEGANAPLLGVISDGDISRSQVSSPLFMIERIGRAGAVGDLTRIRADTNSLLIDLDHQGVGPEDLISINTEVNDHLIARVLALVEEELRADPPVEPVDLAWAWMSLGSEGRGEMSILTDQDNALVYADPISPEEAERAEEWFRALAERANQALADTGFELCAGEVMARNPKWRHPLREWKEIFRDWILHPEAQQLMEAGIFFDLRGLYGDKILVGNLKSDIADALRKERRFLPVLVANALSSRPPTSGLRRLISGLGKDGTNAFDLKRRGLRPLVDLARVFAMQLGYLDSANTADRFRHAARALPDASKTAENALEAYAYLSEFRFKRHLKSIETAEPPENSVDPSNLNQTQQRMLQAVFSTVAETQDTVGRRYGLDIRN